MLKVYKSPEREMKPIRVFLAGSIDMGASVDWQQVITDAINDIVLKNSKEKSPDVVVFNPRRDDWDASWEQRIDNEQFNEQVTWELDHIEQSDIVVVNFEPNSKSPITMLELGLVVANTPEKLIVRCPQEFYRKGNVDIVCRRNDVLVVQKFDVLVSGIKNRIESLIKERRS